MTLNEAIECLRERQEYLGLRAKAKEAMSKPWDSQYEYREARALEIILGAWEAARPPGTTDRRPPHLEHDYD